MAFVEADEVNSDDNLFISDHSNTLTANRIDNIDPVVFAGSSFDIDVNTFLLTDEFTVATATHAATPLFFKHLIDISRYDPATDQITSLEVLDARFRVIPEITQLVVKTSSHDGSDVGTVFNNLQNDFNSFGVFTVYYLRYSIKKSGQIKTYVDILNNKPVYREATFSDLDSGNLILPDRKVYVIEEASGNYLVSQLVNGTYAYLQFLKSRIGVTKPTLRDSNDDWFLSISNGQFFSRKFNDSNVVKYSISEFSTQLFSPFFPYKTITREESDALGGALYKTANKNIVIDSSQDFNVVVELLDEDDSVSSSFTTAVPGVGIRSVDQLNGFVDLYQQPASNLTVKISYTFEEREYQFTEVDFNPANNIDVTEESVVVYAIPQTAARDRTLFYLRVDALGKIIFSSEAEYGDDYGLTIETRMADPLDFYYDKATLNQDSFLNLYTVETTLASGVNYLSNPGFLVLAEMYVGESISENDLNIVDIRRRGGGIIAQERKSIVQQNFESIWNWDIAQWDGQPYPGAATCLVEVPCELLLTHGGLLESIELRPIVQEHMAFGVYPIIKTYGADPIITSVEIRSTEVDMEWTDLGPDVTYNVYMATTENGPFDLLTATPLAVNTYTATGLASETKYWFFATGIKNGHECTDADDVFILSLETS